MRCRGHKTNVGALRTEGDIRDTIKLRVSGALNLSFQFNVPGGAEDMIYNLGHARIVETNGKYPI